jgi:hypothetical protein
VRPKISRPREEGSINAVNGQGIILEVNTYEKLHPKEQF